MQNNNIEPQNFQQDEIDFRELFSILSSSKNYIIAITLIFTILATGYAFITEKPPIYMANALVMIGHIENEQFKTASELYEELVVLYPKKSSYNFKAKAKKYISITVKAPSNALAAEKINNVIDYIKKDGLNKLKKHSTKINDETNLITIELEKISNYINTIEKIESERLIIFKSELIFLQNELIELKDDYKMTQLVGELKLEGPLIESKKQKIILGLFSGLFLSILLAFFRNALRKKDRIKPK